MGKTHAYTWEVMTQGELEGLFDLVKQTKPQHKTLTTEEIWKLCGLEKFGTIAPSLIYANFQQSVAKIVGNSRELERFQQVTKSER